MNITLVPDVVNVSLAVRRFPGFLSALNSLNSLAISDIPTILAIARNLEKARDIVENFETEQEAAVKGVIDQINRPTLATPNAQVQANPDFVIKTKLRELGNVVVSHEFDQIDFQKLVEGSARPAPGAVAELFPILINVHQ